MSEKTATDSLVEIEQNVKQRLHMFRSDPDDSESMIEVGELLLKARNMFDGKRSEWSEWIQDIGLSARAFEKLAELVQSNDDRRGAHQRFKAMLKVLATMYLSEEELSEFDREMLQDDDDFDDECDGDDEDEDDDDDDPKSRRRSNRPAVAAMKGKLREAFEKQMAPIEESVLDFVDGRVLKIASSLGNKFKTELKKEPNFTSRIAQAALDRLSKVLSEVQWIPPDSRRK